MRPLHGVPAQARALPGLPPRHHRRSLARQPSTLSTLPGALGEPRQQARFLCGLSSPAITQARLAPRSALGLRPVAAQLVRRLADEGRRRRGAGQARARGRARRGRPRLFRPPAALWARIHRAGAVRPAPDLGGVVGGRAGGDGFRRGAPDDPRHGRVPPRAVRPARSDQPLAAEPVRAGQGQPAAHRLRRGRGGAHHPRRRSCSATTATARRS